MVRAHGAVFQLRGDGDGFGDAHGHHGSRRRVTALGGVDTGNGADFPVAADPAMDRLDPDAEGERVVALEVEVLPPVERGIGIGRGPGEAGHVHLPQLARVDFLQQVPDQPVALRSVPYSGAQHRHLPGMPLGRVFCQLDPDPGRIWNDYESVFNAQGTPDDLALRRLIFAER